MVRRIPKRECSGVTSLSLVFDDVIGSVNRHILAPVDDPGVAPSWVRRPATFDGTNTPALSLQRKGGEGLYSGEVTIENDEISWEPFYVAVEVRI